MILISICVASSKIAKKSAVPGKAQYSWFPCPN